MSFGKRLNQILLDRDMSPAQLSKMLEWNTGVLSQYLNNPKRDPRLSTAVKIADALGVSLDYLAGRETGNHPPSYSDARQQRMNDAYERMTEAGKDMAASAVVGMLQSDSAREEEEVQGAVRRTA